MTLCIPISPRGLDQGIIAPVLHRLAAYNNAIASDDARAMLLRTAAAESELMWLEEHGDGPSRGYWQVHCRLWYAEMERFPFNLGTLVEDFLPPVSGIEGFTHAMTWNPWACCAVARCVYWLNDPEPMPPWNDADAQGERWKAIYNTELGAGTPEGFRWKCHETGVEEYISEVFEGQRSAGLKS